MGEERTADHTAICEMWLNEALRLEVLLKSMTPFDPAYAYLKHQMEHGLQEAAAREREGG